MKKHTKNKKKQVIAIIVLVTITIIIITLNREKTTSFDNNNQNTVEVSEVFIEKATNDKKSLGWELTLANADNKIPDNYEITLSNIDQYRQFDSRAIQYLQNMIEDVRKTGIQNIWVQSSYRSIEQQTEIYNRKVKYYEGQGKTKTEAKELTEKVIMIPGCSNHNLGLAVDFNNVNENFENTKAYKWLKENAEDYGFVLRYPKDKESITKITYEPWHWRYVGKENAKKMNELNMCLEEYVEYLEKK